VPALLLAATLLVAGWLYAQFCAVHRHLWDSSTHDRNAHYLYSLKLATALRHGRVLRFLDEVQRARVWPPLHGLLAGGVLTVGGRDYRLAVLPSLAGWVGTVLLAFLLARRAVPRGGDLAGLTAALFVLVSPSYRAYATDIMLESLGACLTLLALYCYARAAECPLDSPWPGRCLGLALTALFLEKYNYWLLAVLALLAAELATRPRLYVGALRSALAAVDWRRWLGAQALHPLVWLLAGLLALIALIYARGERPLLVGGKSIGVYPPDNFIHAAYIVFFLRLAAWWRGGLGRWVAGLDSRWRQVVLWHFWPLAGWLLLPKHPGAFLWYLSPANAAPAQDSNLLAGLREYSRWAAAEYHTGLGSAVLAVGLFAVALLFWRRLRPAGRVALCLVLLAAVLAVVHPNRKARNLHSWLAVGWAAAGAGLAALACVRWQRWPRVGAATGGAALLALGAASYPALWAAARSPEGGPHPERVCMLDLTDTYLADLRHHRATILGDVPVEALAQWTFLERYGRLEWLEQHRYGFGPVGEANRRAFLEWLKTTSCDTLVYVERIAGPPIWEPVGCPEQAELRDLLWQQHTFRLAHQQTFPQHACRVLVWRRGPQTKNQGEPGA
jgi:hypothetical protein